MDGSARLFISCPKNRGFPANSGLEMNLEAHPFISWHKNELAGRFSRGPAPQTCLSRAKRALDSHLAPQTCLSRARRFSLLRL